MRCFVIMPFDSSFVDVYTTIRQAVTSVRHESSIDCIRLDDTRPAGRITERLLTALRDSSFCVADLTGCKPNVMWETGYAMALGKPLIIVTQDVTTLPFDLRDMQALPYDRTQLSKTLATPLQDIVRDTLLHDSPQTQSSAFEEQSRLVVSLGVQLAELKEMVGQIVSSWDDRGLVKELPVRLSKKLLRLQGSWKSDNNSHKYIQVVNDYLVGPYCYEDNTELTGYYYDCQEMGEYLFARFRWVSGTISGFVFLKQTSPDTLQGAWWYDYEVEDLPKKPPKFSGNQILWRRTNLPIPEWASEFLDQVEQKGLPD